MPYLRYTPIMHTRVTCDDGTRQRVGLKLENQQVTGDFSVRGMLNAALALPPSELAKGLAGYGVMVGSAVAFVGQLLQVPTTVYVSETATPDVVKLLEYYGAEVIITPSPINGDARQAAFQRAERDGLVVIRPSASPEFTVGCATTALEILEFMPDLDVVVSPVGFGTLVAGIAAVVKLVRPGIRVVCVDRYPVDQLDTAPVTGRGGRLAIGRNLQGSTPLTVELVQQHVDQIVFVSGDELECASRLLWTDMEVRTGMLGAGGLAAVLARKVQAHPAENVCVIVTTAGGEGMF